MTMIRVRRRHKSTDVVVDDDDYDVGRPSTSMASSATTTTTSSDDVVGDSDHLRFRRAGLVQDFKSVSMRVRDRSWNRNRRLKTESDSDSDSDSESTNSDSWPDSRDGEPIERRREPAKPTESTGRPRDDEMFAPRRIRRRKNSADVDVEKMKKTCSRRSRQPMFASGLLFLLVAFTAFGACRAIREVRCPTIDIRNNPDGLVRKSFYSLGDTPDVSPTSCTVVEGSFVIAMVTNKNRNVSYPRFENLREITGSLLVFSAAGLKNLSSVLPKLRVIGGQHLVQHYAFVVFQNDDLEELGLWNLSLIRNGGVRIANNRLLCGATSIDWKRIAASKLNDIVVDNSVEASYTETGKICDSGNCQNDPDKDNPKCRYLGLTHGAQLQSCWDRNHCQRECAYDRDNEAAGPGCDPEGRRCHEECVGGCEVAGDATRCHACKRLNFKGRCVSKCPPELYSLLNRRCVTRAQCKKLYSENNRPLKAINGLCSARCPENYEEDPSNPSECLKCQTACQVTCAGNVTIDSYARALTLKGCHIIDGWLSVEIRAGLDAAGTVEFSEAFHKIHTIKGYLMIFHTPSFLNLFMFKSLRRITGEILYQRKYALSVFENTSIRKLFDPSLNLIIDEGALQFHNNRMLCFRQIMQLMEKLGRENEMNDADQSRSSNGDKAICEDSTFDVNVTAVSHHNFLLEWPAFNTSDMDHRKFLGYEVFYKEVQRVDKNMSIDDDRSACSDSWFSEFVERDKNELSRVSTLVSNHVIKPNTIYAFYVSTQIVHHPGARNAISSIGFVQTNFTVPEPPKINQYTATAGDITIEWDPPSKPNGVITHYVVSWRQMEPDLEYYSSMACEATTNERLQSLRPDATPTAVGGDQATASSTAAPTLTSFIAGQVAKEQGGTCSTLPGCCECNKPMSVEQTEDETNFENEVHNAVFVQNYRMVAKRRRRAIEASPETSTVVEVDDVKDEQLAGKEKGKKPRVRVPSTKNALGGESGASSSASTPTSFVDEVAKSVKRVEDKKIADRMWRENVTAAPENSRNKFVIKGLKHFTEYSISVSACQDLKVRDNYCSQARRAQKTIRTQRLPDVDEVRNETIHIEKINSTTSTVRITWEPPEAPNGGVIGYRVTLENALVEAAPHQTCQESYDGNWTSAVDGVLFKNLADGDYRVEVVTIAMGGLSKASTPSDVITIHTPGFWTLRNSILVATSVTLVLLIIGIIAYYFVRKYYGAKVKEYATQLISANPDYLSQQDVYKADEWELKRTDVTIQEEIGRGTFGSVFRGFGHNVKSQCGEIFGQCAIKTVTETASNAERLHFLLEANVMKTFNSSFIVKLYGVVSDGQPVLVVMEMMAKGNLRDYLRARRPGAEENTENLPVPTKEQYCEWAAQIADGMAYLESIRFCHRDLAARNCMVAADDVVKIGDFGMARDLYYHEYYKPTGKRLMPVRWMAPESLKDGKFDSKSDMWSYGIVLYEMLTLGQQPYQGLANDEVLNFIGMSRKVLEQPEECPNSWYEVMKLCWKYSPRDRPTFAQLVRRLAVDASPEFHRLAYVMNTPFDPVNDGHLGEGDGHDFDDRQAEGAIGVEVLNDDDEDDDDVDDDDDDDDDDDEPVYVVEPGTQAIQMKELKSKYSSNASLIGDDGDYISHGEDSQGNSGYTSNRGESDEPTWGDDERMAMMGDHERP